MVFFNAVKERLLLINDRPATIEVTTVPQIDGATVEFSVFRDPTLSELLEEGASFPESVTTGADGRATVLVHGGLGQGDFTFEVRGNCDGKDTVSGGGGEECG